MTFQQAAEIIPTGDVIRAIAYASGENRTRFEARIVEWADTHYQRYDPRGEIVNKIIAEVAHEYGVSEQELLRRNSNPWPAHVAAYIMRGVTDFSLPHIGRRLDGRHHTTVLHCIRQVEGRIKSDPEFASFVNAAIARFSRVGEMA